MSLVYEQCTEFQQSVSQHFRTSVSKKTQYPALIELPVSNGSQDNRTTFTTPLLGTVCVSKSVSKIHDQQIMHVPLLVVILLSTWNVFDELAIDVFIYEST